MKQSSVARIKILHTEKWEIKKKQNLKNKKPVLAQHHNHIFINRKNGSFEKVDYDNA